MIVINALRQGRPRGYRARDPDPRISASLPANDGKLIRISIPPLTEERRKDLVKQVRKIAEEHKVGVREGRRDALSMLKDLESDGTAPKDDRHRADKSVQDLTDEYVKKIDEMTAQKEKEVLEV